MPFSLTDCQNCKKTMKNCNFPTDLNEIKPEVNSKKVHVSSGMIHRNSSKLMPCFWLIFAVFQNQILNSNLNPYCTKVGGGGRRPPPKKKKSCLSITLLRMNQNSQIPSNLSSINKK